MADFLCCKFWFFILFIIAKDLSKDFVIDLSNGGLSLVTNVFTLEIFEILCTFSDYSFGVFFP